jgi:hypothetical protein
MSVAATITTTMQILILDGYEKSPTLLQLDDRMGREQH